MRPGDWPAPLTCLQAPRNKRARRAAVARLDRAWPPRADGELSESARFLPLPATEAGRDARRERRGRREEERGERGRAGESGGTRGEEGRDGRGVDRRDGKKGKAERGATREYA